VALLGDGGEVAEVPQLHTSWVSHVAKHVLDASQSRSY
jgi:hypothetical protein